MDRRSALAEAEVEILRQNVTVDRRGVRAVDQDAVKAKFGLPGAWPCVAGYLDPPRRGLCRLTAPSPRRRTSIMLVQIDGQAVILAKDLLKASCSVLARLVSSILGTAKARS